jgi:hypothetical protein
MSFIICSLLFTKYYYDNQIAGSSGRAVLGVCLDRLDAETVGSNPAKGMDVCSRLFIIIHFSPYHRRCIVYLLRKDRKIN